jgi:DNA-binding MarR family transcriptional regulator
LTYFFICTLIFHRVNYRGAREHEPAPDERGISSLRRIIRAIDLHSRHLADRFSVTGPQLIALQGLSRLGRVPVGVLARDVCVSHPTMTGILDRLEKRGLVRRSSDTRDRRRVTAEVTARGIELLSPAPSPLQDRFRSAFTRLEDWEQTQMLVTLQRIAAMMDAEELDAAPMLTIGPAVGTAAPRRPAPPKPASDEVADARLEPVCAEDASRS